jgi:hypothetical protein
MRRRALLKRLGTGATAGVGTTVIAGCAAISGRGTPETCTDSTTHTDGSPTTDARSPEAETTTDRTDVQRTITLADQDTAPEKYGVDLEVEMLETVVTDEHTARLRLTTTNTGGNGYISRFSCPPFSKSEGGSDRPPGLWLYPANRTQSLDRTGARWTEDREPDDSRGFNAAGCGGGGGGPTTPASTPHSVEYAVWDDYQFDGYLVPGRYRFVDTVLVQLKDENPPDADEVRWGFSLDVEC